jgi:peptidyl-tRNA hydrolase
VTRSDLSAGYQATQAAHAALDFAVAYPEITRAWHDTSNYLIVLAAADEDALTTLASTAWERGLRYSIFTEPDLGDAITAVVIEPGEAASRLCSNLPLALREVSMA